MKKLGGGRKVGGTSGKEMGDSAITWLTQDLEGLFESNY